MNLNKITPAAQLAATIRELEYILAQIDGQTIQNFKVIGTYVKDGQEQSIEAMINDTANISRITGMLTDALQAAREDWQNLENN